MGQAQKPACDAPDAPLRLQVLVVIRTDHGGEGDVQFARSRAGKQFLYIVWRCGVGSR